MQEHMPKENMPVPAPLPKENMPVPAPFSPRAFRAFRALPAPLQFFISAAVLPQRRLLGDRKIGSDQRALSRDFWPAGTTYSR